MPTLLVNSKMNPALAARVRASVSGKRAGASRARTQRALRTLSRLLVVVAVTAIVASVLVERQTRTSKLEEARASILAELHKHGAALPAGAKSMVSFAEQELRDASGEYSGDVVAESLKQTDALVQLLQSSTIYVRAPLAHFRTAEELSFAAAKSRKDPLSLCLLAPPESAKEKDLLQRVYTAYRSGARLQDATPNLHRLYSVVSGLPVLAPSWAERVRAAPDLVSVEKLRKVVQLAPLAEAVEAAQAQLLLYAMDEQKEDDSPMEFDGASQHSVRIGLIELSSGETLLRLRRQVDPSWISENKRHHYAKGLTACKLATEVHASVTTQRPTLKKD